MGERSKTGKRRGLALAFIAGVGVTLCCASSEEVIIWARYVLFDDTKAGLKAQTVQQALDQLAQRVSRLETNACPRGYVQDTTEADITLCTRGADEVVKAGSFWVDRYEMSVVDAKTHNKGTCNGAWTQHGEKRGEQITVFPGSGNWKSTKLYACSVKGKRPSRNVTWFQASQACLLAGKRLCTNAEWQAAAAGTPKDSCNIKSNDSVTSDRYAACQSKWGARHMVGNLSELVAAWIQSGLHSMSKNEQRVQWPKGFGDKDMSRNFNGEVDAHQGNWVKGLPATFRRGGDFDDTTDAGIFAVDAHIAPTYASESTGARCCLR